MRVFNETLSNQSTSEGLAIGQSLGDVLIIILPPVASKLLLILFQLKCRNANFLYSYITMFLPKNTASQVSAISFEFCDYVYKKLLDIKIMWLLFFSIVTEDMFI